ncbi:MAG: Mur ligase family protein [Candidatus Latescibacterota bacterium]|nr:Mur ligase family protein [Candidatus Latescibacterota bacterium]
MKKDGKYFFCGVGGSGMSAIAQVLVGRGIQVLGSDRYFDCGLQVELFSSLVALGISMVPQDGSAVDENVTELIVSSAVESSIPDVSAAQKLGVPIRNRAELLADLFNMGRGISVGGTSGKSTVTGMIGYILHAAGKDPTIVSGGKMRDFENPPNLGNAVTGKGAIVIEADESDGTIKFYNPQVSVLTNVSFDHKPVKELIPLFRNYCAKASDVAVVNADCSTSMEATVGIDRLTFGLDHDADYRARDIVATANGMRFTVNGLAMMIPQLGRHNVANTLAAIATCEREGVSLDAMSTAMATFKGIARRMETVGSAGSVTVLDDFAHNPDKISAAISALKAFPGRLHVMFQPHGFGPTKMLKTGLVQAFIEGLGKEDHVWMPEIFYAGGTADKSISSADLVNEIDFAGIPSTFVADREDLVMQIVSVVEEGDRIVIMGARDDTLTEFGRELLHQIEKRAS